MPVKRSSSLLFVLAFVLGCGGGSDRSDAVTESLELLEISVPDGAVWQINRAIEFRFSAPVDFSTVSSNTLSIQTLDGVPAIGQFSSGRALDGSADESVVVFRPSCGVEADLSDAGFLVGGVAYNIYVPGLTAETENVIRSEFGRALGTSQTRTFTTTSSSDPMLVFVDSVPGPPLPVMRARGSDVETGSSLELGSGERVWLEFEPGGEDSGVFAADFQLPLNLFSDPESRVVADLVFNQAVDPSTENIAGDRLRFEALVNGFWRRLPAAVRLVENCSERGARVRVEPEGILPVGRIDGAANVRLVVGSGFSDIVGEQVNGDLDDFCVLATRRVDFASLDPAHRAGDGLTLDFSVEADEEGSFEDVDALFDSPRATVGPDGLTARVRFEGTGGPGGEFDVIFGSTNPRAPEVNAFFDTTRQLVEGGPNGAPTSIQESLDGVLQVRNLVIEPNATLTATGPNPLVIFATGDVIVRGGLSVNGTNAQDVFSFNTANVPQPGGAGQAGGGAGGTASLETTGSTMYGGDGAGAFGAEGLGGQGGMAQFFLPAPGGPGVRGMRPGGGGGGAHSAVELPVVEVFPWPLPTGFNDQVTPEEDPNRGLVARQGIGGHPAGQGADPNVSGNGPAIGGAPGPLVFTDERDDNDFFGVRPTSSGLGEFQGIRGELVELVPGTGGGAGGDGVPANVFPHPNFNPTTDVKGAGGGGGAGAIRILALGNIVVTGRITANGGSGGVGENLNFLDHIGGGGGAGSGGHIVLETASKIYLGREPDGTQPVNEAPVLTALGGAPNFGPRQIQNQGDQTLLAFSFGGSGGAGLIQLHAPDPTLAPSSDPEVSNIVLPAGAGSSIEQVTSPTAIAMVPSFGTRSRARTRWISLGASYVDRFGEPTNPVEFLFDGVDEESGELELTDVATDVGLRQLAPSPDVFPGTGSRLLDETNVRLVGIDGVRFEAEALAGFGDGAVGDVYLRSPALLRGLTLVATRNVDSPSRTEHRFPIVAAEYDDVAGSLELTTRRTAESLLEVTLRQGTQSVEFSIRREHLRVSTDVGLDRLPSSSSIRLRYQAAGRTPEGEPDLSAPLVDWTSDFGALDLVEPGALGFLRLEVQFDLDATDPSFDPLESRISLESLRLPFRF